MNKVLIGVCTRGQISVGTARFLIDQKHDIAFGSEAISATISRSIVAHKFLKGNYTHLYFLDDDIKPPIDCIERLLRHDKDIVEANYLLFLDGHLHPAAYRKVGDNEYASLQFGERGLKEVDAIGLGACLIKRRVIEECMKKDCFRLELEKDGRLAKGEDIIFSEVAKKLGFGIWYDFSIRCEHYKTVNLNDFETLLTS